MVKVQYILLIHEVQKKICGSLNQQKVLSVNYVVMDMNNIVLWVSVCVRNMQDCFGSIVKLYGKLIKVSSTM